MKYVDAVGEAENVCNQIHATSESSVDEAGFMLALRSITKGSSLLQDFGHHYPLAT